MLIKFFKHGNTSNPTGGRSGGGGAVRDYLLGKDGKPRDGATLVRGNADITTEIINASKNKKIYTSGVISFSNSEYPTAQAKHDLMADFEATLFHGLEQDQYSGYWVEHQDKDRTELHFVFANTELTTGKALPVYFHATDLDLVNSWGKVMIDKYGFIDPNSPEHQRDLAPTTVFDNDKAEDKDSEFEQAYEPKKLNNEQLKQQITNRLLGEIDSKPDIKSQADIIKTLQGMGHEVTRWGKTENKKGKADKSQEYISIKNPNGGQNLRLKGALFSPDFTRKDLPKFKEQRIAEYKADHAQRIANYQSDLATQLQKRKGFLQKRFPIDRTPADNDLTRKIAQIQQAGEAKYKQAKETLAKYDNRTLAPDDLNHYSTRDPAQLESERKAQLQIIADIQYRIASGDDLTSQDEAEYSQAKAFTNSIDNILEQQRQAEKARLEALEAQRLADEKAQQRADQLKQDTIKNQVDKFGAVVSKILPPIEYAKWERLFTDELLKHRDSEQAEADSIRAEAGRKVMPDIDTQLAIYQRKIDNVTTIEDITATRDRIEQHNAQINALLDDMTAYTPESLSGDNLQQCHSISDSDIIENKEYFDRKANALFSKVQQDNILLTPEELSYYKICKNAVFTLYDITAQRYELAHGEALTINAQFDKELAHGEALALNHQYDQAIAQRIAEEQARQKALRLEGERLAQLAKEEQFKKDIQNQLTTIAGNIGEVSPFQYIKLDTYSDERLAQVIQDNQTQGQSLFEKANISILTPRELVQDKTIKDIIVTGDSIIKERLVIADKLAHQQEQARQEAQRIAQEQALAESQRLAEEQARLAQEQAINAQLVDMTAYAPKALSTDQLPTWQALDDEAIAQNKTLFEQRASNLLSKVKDENILLTPDELAQYKIFKDVVFTLDDITAQNTIAQQQEAERQQAIAQAEAERQAQLRLETDRLAQEQARQEAQRIAQAQKQEQARLAQIEAERLAQERKQATIAQQVVEPEPIAPIPAIEPTIAYEPPKPTPAPIAPIITPMPQVAPQVVEKTLTRAEQLAQDRQVSLIDEQLKDMARIKNKSVLSYRDLSQYTKMSDKSLLDEIESQQKKIKPLEEKSVNEVLGSVDTAQYQMACEKINSLSKILAEREQVNQQTVAPVAEVKPITSNATLEEKIKFTKQAVMYECRKELMRDIKGVMPQIEQIVKSRQEHNILLDPDMLIDTSNNERIDKQAITEFIETNRTKIEQAMKQPEPTVSIATSHGNIDR